jgi:hypothetical protein
LSIERKRLYFDIEVSPDIGLFWTAGYKQNIDYDNIIKERAIICICYKWEGVKTVQSLTWDSKQCDKKLLKEFVAIAASADEMIGHNGDKFDLAWIRTRCLFHRIPMFPKYLTVDTLKISRSKFRFNSNRLDYIGKFLGLGSKIKTGYGLWKDVLLNKSDKALNEMVKYCKQDVLLLESIYEVMKNHIEPKVNYSALYKSHNTGCPECGSNDLKPNGTRSTLTGTIKRQFLCRDCGKYHSQTIRQPKVK